MIYEGEKEHNNNNNSTCLLLCRCATVAALCVSGCVCERDFGRLPHSQAGWKSHILMESGKHRALVCWPPSLSSMRRTHRAALDISRVLFWPPCTTLSRDISVSSHSPTPPKNKPHTHTHWTFLGSSRGRLKLFTAPYLSRPCSVFEIWSKRLQRGTWKRWGGILRLKL